MVTKLNLKNNEKESLEELKQNLFKRFSDIEIILFGSKARGESREFSDMDILILVGSQVDRTLKEKISEIKYKIELKYDVVFGTIIENKNFWASPLAKAMPIHWNIDKEGISI